VEETMERDPSNIEGGVLGEISGVRQINSQSGSLKCYMHPA
jgi:hypothetical protein